jgi:hypothetical protein
MSDIQRASSDLSELKKAPTALAWELEIRRVLFGTREQDVNRLGSVYEYCEVILDGSTDHAEALTMFHEALRNIVYAWHPTRPESGSFIAKMLEFISAFTPPEGFSKILEYIRDGHRFGENAVGTISIESAKDIHMKSLVALSYYPLSTGEEGYGFVPYTEALRIHLQEDDYCAYALRRLYELGVVKLDDEEVTSAIEKDANVVDDLISTVLESQTGATLSGSLSTIYAQCLRVKDMPERFEAALSSHSAEFEHEDIGPLVHLGTELLALELPDDDELGATYMAIRWARSASSGNSKLNDIIQETASIN